MDQLVKSLGGLKLQRWFDRIRHAIKDKRAHELWEFCMADILEASMIEPTIKERSLIRDLLDSHKLPKERKKRLNLYRQFFSAWLALAKGDDKYYASVALKEINIQIKTRIMQRS